MTVWKRWLLCAALSASACGDDTSGTGGDGERDGSVDLDGGADASPTIDARTPRDSSYWPGYDGGEEDAAAACSALKVTFRDFKGLTNPPAAYQHPDFENYEGDPETKGLVQTTLGTDNNPVYAWNGCPRDGGACGNRVQQISDAGTFAQWYRDDPETDVAKKISITIPGEIPLTKVPATDGGMDSYEFASSSFFPIDGKGFGNTPGSNPSHNFHFTTEVHTSFNYGGGEVFSFQGDDDLWIFVNGKLALDLGGLHPAVMGTIDFDAKATELGIERGRTYRMDIFHAERHTTASNFRVRTTIDCFVDVPVL